MSERLYIVYDCVDDGIHTIIKSPSKLAIMRNRINYTESDMRAIFGLDDNIGYSNTIASALYSARCHAIKNYSRYSDAMKYRIREKLTHGNTEYFSSYEHGLNNLSSEDIKVLYNYIVEDHNCLCKGECNYGLIQKINAVEFETIPYTPQINVQSDNKIPHLAELKCLLAKVKERCAIITTQVKNTDAYKQYQICNTGACNHNAIDEDAIDEDAIDKNAIEHKYSDILDYFESYYDAELFDKYFEKLLHFDVGEFLCATVDMNCMKTNTSEWYVIDDLFDKRSVCSDTSFKLELTTAVASLVLLEVIAGFTDYNHLVRKCSVENCVNLQTRDEAMVVCPKCKLEYCGLHAIIVNGRCNNCVKSAKLHTLPPEYYCMYKGCKTKVNGKLLCMKHYCTYNCTVCKKKDHGIKDTQMCDDCSQRYRICGCGKTYNKANILGSWCCKYNDLSPLLADTLVSLHGIIITGILEIVPWWNNLIKDKSIEYQRGLAFAISRGERRIDPSFSHNTYNTHNSFIITLQMLSLLPVDILKIIIGYTPSCIYVC